MQLITPFPRSVALADPRSAAAAGAGACTQLTRAPAKKREPRLRRSQRADVHSQQELDVTAINCHHHFCEELCEIGRRWKSPDGARACSRIAIVYFTQRTQEAGFAIPRMKHNAHAHSHSSARKPVSERRYGVSGLPRQQIGAGTSWVGSQGQIQLTR